MNNIAFSGTFAVELGTHIAVCHGNVSTKFRAEIVLYGAGIACEFGLKSTRLLNLGHITWLISFATVVLSA